MKDYSCQRQDSRPKIETEPKFIERNHNMKKIALTLAVLTLTASGCIKGCNKDEAPATTEAAAPVTAPATTEQPASAPAADAQAPAADAANTQAAPAGQAPAAEQNKQ